MVKLCVDRVRLIWEFYHAGLTQKEIARRIPCHPNTVCRVLKRAEPIDARAVGPVVEVPLSSDSGDVLGRMKDTLVGLFNAEGDSDRKRRLAETIQGLDSEILKRTPVTPTEVHYTVGFLDSCPTKLTCPACGNKCAPLKPSAAKTTEPDEPSNIAEVPPEGSNETSGVTEGSTVDEAKLDSMVQAVEAQRDPRRKHEREPDFPMASI